VISVVIPAYNEETLLRATLKAVFTGCAEINECEVIVVDNESTDGTAEIAASYGSKVIAESIHNIATVRNRGAEEALGDLIVFIDADTIIRPTHLQQIEAAMSDQKCFGGAVRVEYEGPYTRFWMGFFMKIWVVLGKVTRIRGGALQFCRADIFRELRGYDESIWVGEDVEFHWRLDKLAFRQGGHTTFIEQPPVVTSSRRWNRMGLLRMLFFTHPITILVAWRWRSFWKDWYERAIR
jgi:glycosyltransferase involved in cell wall biosynthesis